MIITVKTLIPTQVQVSERVPKKVVIKPNNSLKVALSMTDKSVYILRSMVQKIIHISE